MTIRDDKKRRATMFFVIPSTINIPPTMYRTIENGKSGRRVVKVGIGISKKLIGRSSIYGIAIVDSV